VNFSTRNSTWYDQKVKKTLHYPAYTAIVQKNISKNSARYEAFIAHYCEATFKLLLCCSDEIEHPREQDYIKGGDIIKLYHTDIEGYLSADQCW